MNSLQEIFSLEEREAIEEAIRVAETRTSGEIRVRVERNADPLLQYARKAFHELGMRATRLRNGVLFFLAVEDRKFIILADDGIYNIVPEGFWDGVQQILEEHFREERVAEGLMRAIALAGEQLAIFFPAQRDDVNELPDAISFAE